MEIENEKARLEIEKERAKLEIEREKMRLSYGKKQKFKPKVKPVIKFKPTNINNFINAAKRYLI